MGHRFAEIAFTPNVRDAQEDNGSRRSYARMEDGQTHHDVLGEQEAVFISARDSFYLATVSETGWPYIQHRGGPKGFLTVIDEKTVAFADFRGNRQYVSVGNLAGDDRVSLILVDYPNQVRLKILGRARIVGTDDPGLLERLAPENYRAVIERAFVITVDAFDWNCPQHITPRFTVPEIEDEIRPLRQRIADLEARLPDATGQTPPSE